ncbi:MAG: Uma2 family endonuclease [Limnothrix sp. RL_2_0]|nr:Uma2 family endonuclease [Limnothrix sp. RL_2_0]
MVATSVKRYSFEEYCQYDDGTNTRYELENGYLQAMTPPSFRHILIADKLGDILKLEIIRLGLPLYCLREAGLRILYEKSRIADLMVISKDKVMEKLDGAGIYQATPSLVVEIVSPESVTRDYRYKRSEYATIGVPEYWIVDPKEGKVTVLVFNEGLYDETVFVGEEKIVSPQFLELDILPQVLFQI